MTKVIFLDIDGVLTSSRVSIGTNELAGIGGAWKQFDPVAVQFLNWFSQKYNYKLVISSSWGKIFNDLKSLKWMLSGGGLRIPLYQAHDWRTPDLDAYFDLRGRSWEINKFLNEHIDIEDFIIFDDGMDAGKTFEDKFVLTDPENGLMVRHMIRAIEIAENKDVTKL